ncbi:GIY-YIG nuclease family protein [Methylobacterium sp. A54F]
MAKNLDQDLTDQELLDALGVSAIARPATARSPVEERVITGFEDILRFTAEHGRPPQHGESRDIFERLYAVRLDQLREQPQFHTLLAPLDTARLLHTGSATAVADDLDDEALLAELGVAASDTDDITTLRHVRSQAEVQAAEEIATRIPCADFEVFEPLFARVQRDLDAGVRRTRPFERKAEIEQGRFFILGGQKAYIAEKGEPFVQSYGDLDSRLRVIFDNGTESDMLMRSLQRALTKDEAGRRITEPNAGPLFADTMDEGDIESGTIYVLRSQSEHPQIAAHREVIHKIGVTGGTVEARVANAASDPTYLFAPVEIVTTYKLAGVNRAKLERLLHRTFEAARLDLTLPDRFGRPFRPQEWFIVPFPVIDEAIRRLMDGSLPEFQFDRATASLRQMRS